MEILTFLTILMQKRMSVLSVRARNVPAINLTETDKTDETDMQKIKGQKCVNCSWCAMYFNKSVARYQSILQMMKVRSSNESEGVSMKAGDFFVIPIACRRHPGK